MKKCLIYQPCGLGDIIWVQPIIDKYITNGYTVLYPVIDLYYDMIKNTIIKDNLIWLKESDDFEMKHVYKSNQLLQLDENIYIPLSDSCYYLQGCSVMISKYYFTNTPVSNWHKNINIIRNKIRENKVYNIYNIDQTKPFTLLNCEYGTHPNSITRNFNFIPKTDQIIKMDFKTDQENDINMFDWIGVIETAYEIHTVETSLSFLVDMYNKSEHIYMYERRRDNDSPMFYNLTNKMYRNPNWTYCS